MQNRDTKTTKIAASFFCQLTAVLRYFLSEISSQKSHQIENWKLCCAYSSRMLCVFFANFVRILRICCVYSSCLLHIFFAYVIVTCILRVCCVYTQFPLPRFFNRIFLWSTFEMLIWTLHHDIYMNSYIFFSFYFSAAVIGVRLHWIVALTCTIMAVYIMVLKWHKGRKLCMWTDFYVASNLEHTCSSTSTKNA